MALRVASHPLAWGLDILRIRDGRVSVVRTLIAPKTDAKAATAASLVVLG
jgi:hypothetical protein